MRGIYMAINPYVRMSEPFEVRVPGSFVETGTRITAKGIYFELHNDLLRMHYSAVGPDDTTRSNALFALPMDAKFLRRLAKKLVRYANETDGL